MKTNTLQDEHAPPPMSRDRARELRRDSTDAEQRTKFLEDRGYRILRFWNNEVLQDTDAVLTRIADLL